jgi:DNA polymerase elongation subunit (family B)
VSLGSATNTTLLTQDNSANSNFDLFDDDPRIEERRNNASFAEASDFIVDIREYDVPYHVRVMIDLGRFKPSLS